MSYTEIISCRVAIQVCIGYFSDGRERHRTFSMKGIRPDAPDEAIAAIVRALAPVLVFPITKVRKVVKRTIVFDDWRASAVPAETNRDTGDGIPYTENPARMEPVITNWPEFLPVPARGPVPVRDFVADIEFVPSTAPVVIEFMRLDTSSVDDINFCVMPILSVILLETPT